MLRKIVVGLTALGLIAGLSACANLETRNPNSTVPAEQPVVIEDQFKGYPPGLQDFLATAQFAPDDNVGYVYWRAGKKSIYLTTFGSSSCPLTPKFSMVEAATRLSITATVADKICTADYSPTTFRIKAPAGLSKDKLINLDLRRRISGADQGVSDLKLGSTPTFA